MRIDDAFDAYQATVNADITQVRLARARRDVFKEAFAGDPDVQEVFGSGSLARSTQLKPVHDVDLIVVYDAGEHPGWGQPGGSSEEALRHVQDRTISLLGSRGSVAQLVRETRAAGRNRAVKCFIDPPGDTDAFTVDVMPALRQENGTLLVPSTREQSWSTADPEHLIEEVAKKQGEWEHFRPMVRVLKDWRLGVATKVKSLVMEVLALECLPPEGNRAEALRAFFTAAAVEVHHGVTDPAGYCGDIQPDLNYATLAGALDDAAEAADQACAAAADGDTDQARRHWRSIFGDNFPAPDETASTPRTSPAIVAPAVVLPRPVKDAPQG